MRRKVAIPILFAMVLAGAIASGFNIQPAEGIGIIYIRADGSVEPATAPIQRDGDIYVITGTVYSSILVQKDNIVVDGADHLLYGDGAYESKGINLAGRINVTVKNVEILRFGYGIYFYGSLNNTAFGNNITGPPNNRVGIYLENSQNNVIRGNNITNNGTGIEMWYSSNNTISGNNIQNNWSGIALNDVSDNRISGNNITGHEDYGIQIFGSTNNEVSENNIADNGQWGIYIGLSSNYNTFYHNNFINNKIQVFLHGTLVNTWDITYSSGGNYWSNYTDADEYSGPYQNQTGSDYIWDHPYVIDPNNQDHYPLVNKWSMADVNHDAVVDVLDAAAISAHWYPGPPVGPLGFDTSFDINGDGSVDVLDAALVSAYWTGPPKGPLAP